MLGQKYPTFVISEPNELDTWKTHQFNQKDHFPISVCHKLVGKNQYFSGKLKKTFCSFLPYESYLLTYLIISVSNITYIFKHYVYFQTLCIYISFLILTFFSFFIFLLISTNSFHAQDELQGTKQLKCWRRVQT